MVRTSEVIHIIHGYSGEVFFVLVGKGLGRREVNLFIGSLPPFLVACFLITFEISLILKQLPLRVTLRCRLNAKRHSIAGRLVLQTTLHVVRQ